MILAQDILEKFHPKLGGGRFSAVTSDRSIDIMTMFGVIIEHDGVYVAVKYRDSTSNYSRDIRAAHFVMNTRRRSIDGLCSKLGHGSSAAVIANRPQAMRSHDDIDWHVHFLTIPFDWCDR